MKQCGSLQGHAEGDRESMSKDGNEIAGPRRTEYRLKTEPKADGSAPKGADIIKSCLPKAPATPGVYRMINEAGDVLYVGKAKNIRRRVASYANPNRQISAHPAHDRPDPVHGVRLHGTPRPRRCCSKPT